MHKSSYLRMEYLVNYYEPYFYSKDNTIKVLDVGSYDVNGTYREIFTGGGYKYTGLDMCAGPNVDIVPVNVYQWNEIDDNTFEYNCLITALYKVSLEIQEELNKHNINSYLLYPRE